MKNLLGSGADVNTQGGRYGCAIQAAASFGHETIVQLLINHGTDITDTDYMGRTVLHETPRAEGCCESSFGEWADVNAQDRYGWAPLTEASKKGHDATTKTLLEYGAEASSKSFAGCTALDGASQNGHDLVVLLLKYGVHPMSVDYEGRRCLDWAAMEGNDYIVQILLENGSDPSGTDINGRTSLYRAASRGHDAVARILLAHGATCTSEG